MKKSVQFEVGEDRREKRQRALVKAVIIAAIIEFPFFLMATLFQPYNITDETTGKTHLEFVSITNKQSGKGKIDVNILAIEYFACMLIPLSAMGFTLFKYRE